MRQKIPGTSARRDLSDAQIAEVVTAVVRAPSVHNTQPWLLAADADALMLRADRSRQLLATDPSGRELLLSCGAALLNLRVALRHLERTPQVKLFPDPRDRDLLARVSYRAGRASTKHERQLYAAIFHRHTHRGAFLPGPVAPEVLHATQAAAQAEGGTFFLVEQSSQRQAINDLIATAERDQQADPDMQKELTAWTPPADSLRRDGVPAWSYTADHPQASEGLTTRDFDRARGYGQLPHNQAPPSNTSATIAVLITPTDEHADQIRAGQALQAALLTAAANWVFAGLYSQPLELPVLRRQLRKELRTDGYPHLLLRLGHADTARPTPRRPADHVLQTR